MIDKTRLTKSDAEFYTSLKQYGHDASYSTANIFSEVSIKDLRRKTISFINKVELILKETK